MAKSLSITVHPSALSDEWLTVSDAMKQVLDMVSALEGVEGAEESSRRLTWKLVRAHTNSPPFTVVAEAFSRDPQVSVVMEAERVTRLYGLAVRELISGQKPDWLDDASAAPFGRAFKRNLNGVGLTDIRIGDDAPILIPPAAAQIGLAALDRAKLEARPDDLRRVEYGTVEGRVIGLTRHYNSPALVFQERLSGDKVVCVVSEKLAIEIGPQHDWTEAWEGRHLRVGGQLVYGADGKLKRIEAETHEEIDWADVPLTALRRIDLGERSVQQFLDEFWGEAVG